MKKATCSLLVGSVIAGLVVFLLGVDIASKRRHMGSSLFKKDSNNFSKAPQISDLQILSLVDKRIQKLEDALSNFMHKTNETSKAKRSSIKKKFNNIGDSQKTISDKLSDPSDTPNISSVKFVPLQPVVGKYVLDKKEPQISETSISPKYSSYNAENRNSNTEDEKIRNSPGYLRSLMGKFHIDLLKWALKNEKSSDNIDRTLIKAPSKDKNDIINMTKDIFKRDVVDLTPKNNSGMPINDIFKNDKPNAMAEKNTGGESNKDIFKNDKPNAMAEKNTGGEINKDIFKKEVVDLTPQNMIDLTKANKPVLETKSENIIFPPKSLIDKPKPNGFLTRAIDDSLIPSDIIPNLTDFSAKDASYHPIFFTEKNKLPLIKDLPLPEKSKLPLTKDLPENETSVKKIILPPLKDKKSEEIASSGFNESESSLKKPQLSSEDNKIITEAIDSIFANPIETPKKKEEDQFKDNKIGNIKFEDSEINKANKVFPLKKTPDNNFELSNKTDDSFPKIFNSDKKVNTVILPADEVKKELINKTNANINDSNIELPKPIDVNIKEADESIKLFTEGKEPQLPLFDNSKNLKSASFKTNNEILGLADKAMKPVKASSHEILGLGDKAMKPEKASSNEILGLGDKAMKPEKASSNEILGLGDKATKPVKASSNEILGLGDKAMKPVKATNVKPKVAKKTIKAIKVKDSKTAKTKLPKIKAPKITKQSSKRSFKEQLPKLVKVATNEPVTQLSLEATPKLSTPSTNTDPSVPLDNSSELNGEQIDKIFEQQYYLPPITETSKKLNTNTGSLEIKIIDSMVKDLRDEVMKAKNEENITDESLNTNVEEGELDEQSKKPEDI